MHWRQYDNNRYSSDNSDTPVQTARRCSWAFSEAALPPWCCTNPFVAKSDNRFHCLSVVARPSQPEPQPPINNKWNVETTVKSLEVEKRVVECFIAQVLSRIGAVLSCWNAHQKRSEGDCKCFTIDPGSPGSLDWRPAAWPRCPRSATLINHSAGQLCEHADRTQTRL